jgi:hypothetical protein
MRRANLAGFVAVALLLLGGASARADYYGAIAYSQATGATGWSYNCSSRAEAESIALGYCKADDARIVTWCKNAHCALALGSDRGAYGACWGTTREDAERKALYEASKHTSNCYIKQWVYSGK